MTSDVAPAIVMTALIGAAYMMRARLFMRYVKRWREQRARRRGDRR